MVDAAGGDDMVNGGSWGGQDSDLGGGRTEVLLGGAGNDVIDGNGNAISSPSVLYEFVTGSDVMAGGAGNDRLVADVHTSSMAWGTYRYDGNMMTGGTGADRFEFDDELVSFGHLVQLSGANGGTITDFDPAQGDKLIFDLDDPLAADFVGERADIGVGECGFYRSGGDTFVKYGMFMEHDDFDDLDFLVAIHVRLEDYAGPVTASDVLLV